MYSFPGDGEAQLLQKYGAVKAGVMEDKFAAWVLEVISELSDGIFFGTVVSCRVSPSQIDARFAIYYNGYACWLGGIIWSVLNRGGFEVDGYEFGHINLEKCLGPKT